MLVLCTGNMALSRFLTGSVIGPDSIVGPGKEGVEYSTLLIACFVSILLAYA